MTASTQHLHWPQIAGLKPQLRQHICAYPQEFRGRRWYVLRDRSNGRHLRFSAAAYEFIGRLDGELSVEEALKRTRIPPGDEALSQDDVILILTQLFAIDMLRRGLPTDARELFKRFQHERHLRRKRAIMNPLAIRIPLLDPDAVLNRLMPWVRPLFSHTGAVLWSVVVGLAALLTLINVPALSAAIDTDILAPMNLVSMLLVFITIKAIHEFAHAFAVKMWGGEVHEMGITLLVLAPVPYVDASAAWGFRDKYKRVLVGAAGILVELFLASLALFLWLVTEPGMVRDAALNAFLIGSLSTLLFNANPLLRFDGYYVLQDLLEIPNLYTRSGRYYLYLLQRYLFGLEGVRSPVTAAGEVGWFVVYGLLAFFYRLFILAVIVLFLADEYLFIGVALGTWAVVSQLILPLFRGLRFLFSGQTLKGRRTRAVAVSGLSIGVFAAGLLLLPVSLTTRTEGVVWVSDQARVYAGTEGFVTDLLVPSGSRVESGTAVIQMQALSLDTKIARLDARRRELEIRSAAERLEQRVQSGITREELTTVEAELALLREQASAQLVRTEVSGTLVLPEESTLKGRYLRQGELIGYVFSPERLVVRTVVPQAAIGLVRQQVEQVEVRLAERLGETIQVRIQRQTPAGNKALPSRALGVAGGGTIAVRKADQAGTTAAENVFQVDLGLPEEIEFTGAGERAYVRFDHGSESLARQWLRRGRQLVLSRLSF